MQCLKNKLLGGILGLCVADAVGVPVEFCGREALARKPVTDMQGFGTHAQPPGTWSDDTSMTLCLLDSLSHGVDYGDIMQRLSAWLFEAQYTPYDEVFDVGNTSRDAIVRFKGGAEPLSCDGAGEYDNGNGALMRILPLVFELHFTYGERFFENEAAVDLINNISALTHAHMRSLIACGLYLSVADMLMGGMQLKYAIELGLGNGLTYYNAHPEYARELAHFKRLTEEGFARRSEDDIKSSGYVVDTLEAAIWCLLNSCSYEECVLRAVNLGNDTDTVAAVAGGLAGMHYGYESIPAKWLAKIPKLQYITGLCAAYYETLMNKGIEKLGKHLSYLQEKVDASPGKDAMKSGEDALTSLAYDDGLKEFISDVTYSGLVDYSYKQTINNYGVELNIKDFKWVEEAEREPLIAVLTHYIRGERFCDGMWASAAKSGLFAALIKRLAELLLFSESYDAVTETYRRVYPLHGTQPYALSVYRKWDGSAEGLSLDIETAEDSHYELTPDAASLLAQSLGVSADTHGLVSAVTVFLRTKTHRELIAFLQEKQIPYTPFHYYG